jgi:hypothetical protein
LLKAFAIALELAKLAELLRGGFYRAVYHPGDEEMANLKIAVQHYDQMTRTTTRLQNQIKARFRQQGIMTAGKGVYGLAGRREAISMLKSEAIAEILRQDFRLLDHAQKERTAASRLVTKLSRDFGFNRGFRDRRGSCRLVSSAASSRFTPPGTSNTRFLSPSLPARFRSYSGTV